MTLSASARLCNTVSRKTKIKKGREIIPVQRNKNYYLVEKLKLKRGKIILAQRDENYYLVEKG
jgi:hypothetical protein